MESDKSPEMICKPKRPASKWVEHVKASAKKMGISFKDALSSPVVKSSYKK